jgi:hypothetical protein
MAVCIDQAWHHRIALQIEHARAGRKRTSPRLNGPDVIALDQDCRIFQRSTAGAVDHSHMG